MALDPANHPHFIAAWGGGGAGHAKLKPAHSKLLTYSESTASIHVFQRGHVNAIRERVMKQ